MKKKNSEYLLVGIAFFIGILLFTYTTGTLFSGYHLIDDHILYYIRDMIKTDGLLNVLIKCIQDDFSVRFRPLYTFFRVIGVYFLQCHMLLWSLARVLEFSLAGLFLYIFARREGTTKPLSALFAVMILIGGQTTSLWRIGPQESVGILLFAAGMLCLSFLAEKQSVFKRVLFVIIMILMSLQKESFLMCIPGFFILLFALENHKQRKVKIVASLKLFIKKYIGELIILAIVTLSELIFIYLCVGTNSIGYAGVNDKWSILNFVISIFNNIVKNCPQYMYILMILLLFVFIEIKKQDITAAYLSELCFCIYIFIIEQVLYAESGMFERYFLPWIVSIAYLCTVMAYRVICRNKKLLISVTCMLVISMIYIFANMLPEALDFANEGNELQACVNFILERTEEDASIIEVMRDEELDRGFRVYMDQRYGYGNVSEIDQFSDLVETVENADVIFGPAGQTQYVIAREAGLLKEDWTFFETGHYEVAIKK